MTELPNTVSADLEIVLLDEDALRTVAARLSYAPTDPWAVKLELGVDVDSPVVWIFARKLLCDGTQQLVGEGDVRVGPSGRHGLDLTLSSPGGSARLRADRWAISNFLQRSFAVVAAGAEHEWFDTDAELMRLLAA